MLGQQAEASEQALWTALRTLEESAALRKRIAAHARERRMFAIAERYDRQAAAFEDRAGIGRKVLVTDRLTVGENVTVERVAERARRAGKD